ncbi:single-stranded-DNA-specific exonuclease RecJ [Candidatus Poribacteria bacterium]|nr:single-stranded-DNA-specific exonuclease RecJ [Candidatus Poribacteria bacterium]MYK94694.1 single-stranded-DNA-specific exonuclease RecJ [Candidatus Poribacteria bacterium]
MKKPTRKKWQFSNSDIDSSLTLASEAGVSPFAAQLLINRGIKTAAEARAYLYPTFDELHSPFKLADMDKAVERIHTAISRGEKICVYGDYDIDGTTATALLLHTFRQMDVPADYYIPNRFDEGYGLSEDTIKKIHRENKAKLIITVDCGINSVNEVALANQLGMEVIITDHHQPEAEQPAAHALISPKVPGNEYPYTELAGVGLAFKLAQGLIEDNRAFLESLLDLVALGTVGDLASLTGENRILSRLGLVELDKRERPGIHALCEAAGHKIDTPLDGYALSFKLGPRINAAGRMDTAHKVVELLTTDAEDVATRIASQLNQTNRDRQDLEKQIQDQAVEIIKKEVADDTIGIVVASDKWDGKAQGVVGIVAGRLKETYYKPAIVLAINGDKATGSGRCIEGMNLANSLVACTALLVKHGGHAAAAGLTIETRNIPKFKDAFNEYASKHLTAEALQPKLDLEFETHLSLLTLDSLKELEKFEPFGQKNPSPLFGKRRVKVVEGTPRTMGQDGSHLKMFVSDTGVKHCAIAWGAGDKLVTFNRPNVSLDVAFSPQINEWQGTQSVQLILRDWEVHAEGRDMNWDVFPRLTDESSVKIADRRNTKKKNYLLKLLEREESCIIYVRDEEMLDFLLTKLLPESLEGIAAHDKTTSGEAEAALLKQLARGELRTIASSSSLSSHEAFPFVKHVVFCHLTPSPDLFFKRCAPAFATQETSCLHLIYGDTDGTEMRDWVSKKYPEKAELQRLYGGIRKAIESNGAAGYAEAAILNGTLGTPLTVETGLTIFEELEFIERYGESGHRLVKLRPAQKSDLSRSPTYLRGEWIKQTSPSFIEFQLKENIESMWERVENECQIANTPDSDI